jgi:predicted patatin/cPLA2 family phospholipase
MKIIKHLVFSGGGPIGLVEYGALKYLTVNSIINKKNIESIYSTSIGCVVAFVYMLDFDWTWIDDFYIKRPWEKLVNFSYSTYFNIFNDKGFVNKKIIINALKPLFLAKEIPLTITLLEFYNLTAIEFNIFTCNLTSFKKEKLNYSNTPNLELIDAIYMSLTVPLIFAPLYINNCYYLDGGIFINCPINDCIFDKKCCYDEILCFANDKRYPIDLSNNFYKENNYNYDSTNSQLTQEANFFEYLIYIIKTLFNKLSIIENENIMAIKNTINTCLSDQLVDIKYWGYAFKTETERNYLVKLGELQGEKFINLITNTNESNTNESNTNELNTNELNINELNTNESNINELNINELNTNESNTNESNTNELNTNESNTNELNTNELNTNVSNINELNTNESNIQSLSN